MVTISRPSQNFIQFLDKYKIEYSNVRQYVCIKESSFFDQVIIDSDIEIIEGIKPEIKCLMYDFCSSLFTKGTFDLIKHIMIDVIPILSSAGDHSPKIFSIICTREDDNVELYDFYSEVLNFHKNTNSLLQFERGYGSAIYDNMLDAITYGNYKIFEYIAIKCCLDKSFRNTCSCLKMAILDAKKFNPKILNLMRNYVEITVLDVRYLIENGKIPQLEYIIDLIESGTIVFNESEIEYFVGQAKSPQVKELFKCLKND
jgi:hypothetical protein